jgi:hypothetical protein
MSLKKVSGVAARLNALKLTSDVQWVFSLELCETIITPRGCPVRGTIYVQTRQHLRLCVCEPKASQAASLYGAVISRSMIGACAEGCKKADVPTSNNQPQGFLLVILACRMAHCLCWECLGQGLMYNEAKLTHIQAVLSVYVPRLLLWLYAAYGILI